MINRQNNKQAAFEIFRAMAVSMVLIGHFSDAAQDLPLMVKKLCFAFGYYGIPLFFIISGFLLTASLVSILKNRPCRFAGAASIFLVKRIFRIYPAYLVSLVVSTLYINVQAFDFLIHFFNVHNLFNGFNRSINVVYWTLAVEFQWYLVAPILILLFIKNTLKVQLFLLLIFMLISIALRFHFLDAYLDDKMSLSDLVWIGNDQLIIHLYNFLLGVFLYHCRNIKIKVHLLLRCLLLACLCYIGYIESDLIAGINSYHAEASQYRLILGYLSISILAVIVFAFLHAELNSISYRVVSIISLVSYSLYLYHLPVLYFFQNYNLDWYVYLPAFLLSSVSIAGISYSLVEAPFLKYSSSIR